MFNNEFEINEEFDNDSNDNSFKGNTDLKYFIKYLIKENLSENTVNSYTHTITEFYSIYRNITKATLLSYKGYLTERYKPNTVNVRIQAINKYLVFMRKSNLKLKCIKIQQKPFLENVVSNDDYKLLCKKLKNEDQETLYSIVKFITCTGARVSEVVKFQVRHVEAGIMDLYSKGGKLRRLYIPTRLQNQALHWLYQTGMREGYIFRNKNDVQISPREISKQLKKYAALCKTIPLDTIYPHSFRHRFALNFLEKHDDLMLLADILGHSSIEVTRIYTRRTSAEQKNLISKIVTW